MTVLTLLLLLAAGVNAAARTSETTAAPTEIRKVSRAMV